MEDNNLNRIPDASVTLEALTDDVTITSDEYADLVDSDTRLCIIADLLNDTNFSTALSSGEFFRVSLATAVLKVITQCGDEDK